MREMRNVHNILVEKLEDEIPLWRSRHGWADNNKISLKEIGCDDVDWIHLAQDIEQWRALVNRVINDHRPDDGGSKDL
jgi:hypothetical protein